MFKFSIGANSPCLMKRLTRTLALLEVVLTGLAGGLVAAEQRLAPDSDKNRLLAQLSQAIEVASSEHNRTALSDALFRRSELLRTLGRGGEAGMDERRALGLPYHHIPTNALPDYQRATAVSVEFGRTNHENGLY